MVVAILLGRVLNAWYQTRRGWFVIARWQVLKAAEILERNKMLRRKTKQQWPLSQLSQQSHCSIKRTKAMLKEAKCPTLLAAEAAKAESARLFVFSCVADALLAFICLRCRCVDFVCV